MTSELSPEEKALRDAWLAEMWVAVPEYHGPSTGNPRPVRKAGEKRRKRAA